MTIPAIDLRDPRFETEKYELIEELRAQNFYARTKEGAIVFLNQEDVAEVFRCKDFCFTFNLIDKTRSPYLANSIEHELLNMHGAQHQRLSRLLKQALRDRIIEGLRTKVTVIVQDLISEMPKQGEVEFCSAFADPLPARILGPMFGVPYSEVKGLNDWIRIGGRKVDALQSGVGIEEVEDANRLMHEYLRDLLAQKRTDPGDDLFSELIQAKIDGDRMSEDEVVYLSAELASAGVDTTRTQLPLILNALLEHPNQWEQLRTSPDLALRAVDEGMRFAPLPWVIPHAAVRDFEYKGIAFRKGDLAFAMVPAANRDPEVVSNPNLFDISRNRVRNFAFGYGLHACPGAQIARMEMSIALQALAELPEIRFCGQPKWAPGLRGRTLEDLNLSVQR